jgi:hypothetical protein
LLINQVFEDGNSVVGTNATTRAFERQIRPNIATGTRRRRTSTPAGCIIRHVRKHINSVIVHRGSSVRIVLHNSLHSRSTGLSSRAISIRFHLDILNTVGLIVRPVNCGRSLCQLTKGNLPDM